MKGQKIIFPAIVSVVFVSLLFVLNYSSIYAQESIIDVQLAAPVTTPFGENVEIVITSHSDTVFDREIVNAEHKIQRLQDKADSLQQKADAEPSGKKHDRLQARADRIQAQADKAAANLCTQALNEQTKLAANGKSSSDIDAVVAGCP